MHATALGSRQLSQLLLYLIEESEIPSDARVDISQGMLEDLSHRETTIQTAPDEQTMKSRWIKQRIHGELEAARESWMTTSDGLPVDIEAVSKCKRAIRCRSLLRPSRRAVCLSVSAWCAK